MNEWTLFICFSHLLFYPPSCDIVVQNFTELFPWPILLSVGANNPCSISTYYRLPFSSTSSPQTFLISIYSKYFYQVAVSLHPKYLLFLYLSAPTYIRT